MKNKDMIVLEEISGRHRSAEYQVLFNGKIYGEIYFNLHGYVGHLPTPDGIPLSIGEKPISMYQKYIRKLNREFSKNN